MGHGIWDMGHGTACELCVGQPTLPIAMTSGVCDSDIGRCFCDGKYKRINAPKGSPPGASGQGCLRPLLLKVYISDSPPSASGRRYAKAPLLLV